MYIQFHETQYELIGYNVLSTRFQATIEKGDNTVDSIIADTIDATEIKITDGEEIKGIYSGYIKRIAISIYENDTISIELENTDIQSQIDSLTAALLAVQETQATADSAIAELGETVDSVSETNDTQDQAIIDLSDAVSTLTPEEV